MHCITYPVPVKLIAGIIISCDEALHLTERLLISSFGPIDYKSEKIPFDFTDYYQKDMGPSLTRFFISFKKTINPFQLAQIKLKTILIEKKTASKIKAVKRPVNIDPGYLNDAKLVLATTKDYSHRLYIDKGIYAEVTLSYKDGSFRPMEWTYPDYRTERYIAVFNQIRQNFMHQRKG